MSLVLDSSMALAWSFADEITPMIAEVAAVVVASEAWVPAIWRLEVANGLRMAIRRKRIDDNFRTAALADLGRMPINTDPETDFHAWGAIVQIADQYGLTTYDAAYLELALRRRLPLATLDGDLRDAAVSAGASILGI